MLNQTLDTIDGNKREIARLQTAVTGVQRDRDRLGWDMDEFKEVNQKQKLDVKVEKAELKLQRDTLQQEIKCINEDYNS